MEQTGCYLIPGILKENVKWTMENQKMIEFIQTESIVGKNIF
jgi:hypothetical protein